jgi:predicted nucleic acid-binding protein
MRVVFDTNVVASASFWRGTPFDCLAAWAKGRCEAVVSPALLAEYHETVEELRLEYPRRPFVAWADAPAESATLVFPVERATGATSDPADEMILECALQGGGRLHRDRRQKTSAALEKFSGNPNCKPIRISSPIGLEDSHSLRSPVWRCGLSLSLCVSRPL